MNDPLGDMLTRIRNAQMRGKSSVNTPASKLRRWVLDVLEDEGYIRGYSAIIDRARIGEGHIAFVQVELEDTRSSALAAFNKAVLAVPEIEQCHMTAAGFDYLLKVRTRDISSYRKVLGERISALPHVARTSTFVTMETVKDR